MCAVEQVQLKNKDFVAAFYIKHLRMKIVYKPLLLHIYILWTERAHM